MCKLLFVSYFGSNYDGPRTKFAFAFFFPRRVTERPERHLRKWFYSKQKCESLRWSQGPPWPRDLPEDNPWGRGEKKKHLLLTKTIAVSMERNSRHLPPSVIFTWDLRGRYVQNVLVFKISVTMGWSGPASLHSGHGSASNEPTSAIHRFLWCTIIRVTTGLYLELFCFLSVILFVLPGRYKSIISILD